LGHPSTLALVTGPSNLWHLAGMLTRLEPDHPCGEDLQVVLLVNHHSAGLDPARFVATTEALLRCWLPAAGFCPWDGQSGVLGSGLPVGPGAWKRLLLCRPFHRPDQRLLSLCPAEEVVLFDEGIASYLESPPPAPAAAPVPATRFIRLLSSPPLPSRWAGLPVDQVPPQTMTQLLRQLLEQRPLAPPVVSHGGGGLTVVLGTCFSNYGLVSPEREASHLQAVVAERLRSDKTVLYVPHPRARHSLLDLDHWPAHQRDGRLDQWRPPGGSPAELLGLMTTIEAVISPGSSALITFKEWLSIPAWLSVDEPFEEFGGRSPEVMLLRSLVDCRCW
jgi:hypothetical protein